jgi:hypothetical protein
MTRRLAAAAALAALALLAARTASAENYRFLRTHIDDRAAASVTLKPTDFPAAWRLAGGPTAPDETPSTVSCNGYRPRLSDLVVTGDAASAFADPRHSVDVRSRVDLFTSAKMARADFARQKPLLTARCGAVVAKERHLDVVGAFRNLGRWPCGCDDSEAVSFEVVSPRTASVHLVFVVTTIRFGRVEATVTTAVGTGVAADPAALHAAADVEQTALDALRFRLVHTR